MILIISHQERILNVADKIVLVNDGEVSAVGTKDEILPMLLNAEGSCQTLMDKAK